MTLITMVKKYFKILLYILLALLIIYIGAKGLQIKYQIFQEIGDNMPLIGKIMYWN